LASEINAALRNITNALINRRKKRIMTTSEDAIASPRVRLRREYQKRDENPETEPKRTRHPYHDDFPGKGTL
jgi:hypothetical protein